MNKFNAENNNLILKGFAMTDRTTSPTPEKKNIAEIVINSSMVILMLIFILLYAAAFSGKIDPLNDNTTLLRFEPIIFLLIGYYFGWLPSQHSDKTHKNEITRQIQKADAAQYAKEKAQQERETLEEKIKNAKTVLKTLTSSKTNTIASPEIEHLKTAISILDS